MALDSLGKAPRKSNKRRVTLQELEGMTFKHKVDVCTSFKMSHGVNFEKLKTPRNFQHGLLSLIYKKHSNPSLLGSSSLYQLVHDKDTAGECLCSNKTDGL